MQAGANPKLPATVRFGFYIGFLLGFGLLCVGGGWLCWWCGAGADPKAARHGVFWVCVILCVPRRLSFVWGSVSRRYSTPPPSNL